MTTLVLETPREHVRLVTLNRPDRLNAMSFQLVGDLHGALDEIERDRDCRVAVLTGAGRGFCAGFDLVDPGGGPDPRELGQVQSTLQSMKEFYGLVERLRALPQPVVAAVNGPASGGGFALALACDIRVAAASARFNVAFVRVGFSGCDIGVSYLLPRLIGAARAAELMLTGRMVEAEEARQVGLVSRVVPDGQVIGAALEVADAILANTPFGVRMTKEVMWSNVDAPSLQAAILLEKRTNILTTYTDDRREALAAFTERRPPRFENR